MAFKLDDIIIDRIQMATAEDFDGNLLYTLTQLADATINITAESKDAVDKDGTLIKRFYQGKQGEFTANNAMLNLNIVGAASGEGKEIASEDKKISMPKIATVKAGSTYYLAKKTVGGDGVETYTPDFVTGTITLNALSTNGTMGKAYTLAATADAVNADSFYVSATTGALTLPTDANEVQFVVKYQREVANGVAIKNKADKFPGTVKLTLKALCVDPCSADTLRACYIVLPSFQVSPEVEISLTTDAQLTYTGALQCDYCSVDKTLYEIYICEDDEEE